MMTSLNNSPVKVGLGVWVYEWGRQKEKETDAVMAANAKMLQFYCSLMTVTKKTQ